ncbi:MAG TPA: ABC transporter ATP-binding protein, partial [Candidatus Limnocylindria bacterium]
MMMGRPGNRPGARPGGAGFMGMGTPVEKSKDVRGTLRRLVARLRPERLTIAIVVVLASASVVFSVIGPRLIGNATNVIFDGVIGKSLPAGITKDQAVDALRSHGQSQLADLLSGTSVVPGAGVDFTQLAQILLLAALVYLLASVLGWLQAYLMAGVAQRTVYGLRREVEAKLARLPLRYFDSHPHGDLLSRVTNDVDNITTTLQQGMSQLLTSFLTVVGVLAMMLWISPLLAGIAILTIPLSLVVTVVIAGRSQKEFVAQWARTGVLNGHVEQMHTGHALVQVFGRRQIAIAQFDRLNEQLYAASFKAQFLSGIIQPAVAFLSNLNYVGVAVIGGYRVASGTMTLGDVQAFIQYSRLFTMPLTQIAAQANLLQSGLASAERVFEFLMAPEESADRVVSAALPALAGHVTFDRVSFRYQPDKPLIEDFALDVQPGETVAIVGPTGAGKTTIVNLLMRFYEIDGGAIRLDGTDTRELPRDVVRRAFGMVLQDTWLFTGTIRDNIAYGKEDATTEEIVAAATAAHADQFIRTLPDGYDTVLAEDASNISSGQKQLLTIARAFLADRSVLILDEATSNVDTRT